MGKKSRRQREKDPVNEMVKYQARQTGEGKQQALRRMKEALNSMHPRSAPSVAPAPNVARDDDDDDSELDAVQDAAPAASKPTVAEAEAECRAAMAAARGSADKVLAERAISQADVPRVEQAISALMDAVTLDDDDDSNLTEYLRKRGTRVSSQELIKLIKRWPRIRKYWPRIRRRICSGCGKQYDLSEPRLLVCGECGEGRYCDKACQRAHWPEHRGPCLKTFLEQTKERRSRWDPHGKTIEKLRQDFLKLYPR